MVKYEIKPFILPNPIRWVVTKYGIENGKVFSRKSFLGIRFGNRPSVKIEKISRVYPSKGSSVIGDIVFGEGSHDPVVWKHVWRPDKKVQLLEAILDNPDKTLKEIQMTNNKFEVVQSQEPGFGEFFEETTKSLFNNYDGSFNRKGQFCWLVGFGIALFILLTYLPWREGVIGTIIWTGAMTGFFGGILMAIIGFFVSIFTYKGNK